MTIRIPVKGGEMSAYVALPKRTPGPGIVVIQEIFGVTKSMREICDFLAARQFVAICPDVYWRLEPNLEIPESDHERARALRAKCDDNQVVEDIASSIDYLKKDERCTGSVGVVGYCWGGLLAYLTAVSKKPDAAVAYYGVGIDKHLDKAKNLSCPMVFHYAEKDTFAGPEVAAQVRDTFKNDHDVTVYEYAGAGHAFARPGGANYNHKAADLADMRTLSFLVEKVIGHR